MKYSINARGVPEAIGPYSQGTTAGRLVFASGQLPISTRDSHSLVDGGITEQTERVIDLIEAILAEVGCTLADVAQTTVYLASLDDMEAMNEVYARRFTTPAPARAVVGVSELPLGALVEMDCVACR
ncbi:Rid family detoxifying hydrolase [Olsenella sp. An188]|uniref:Rid family detoxifying hydrolase n=1 Tax=Olsenella sp. An188 TaxID=1965579 RepID=UPI000B36BC24|nr:Rid family detoxifying hydrolase [Olsenella sp. An188]OUP39541.1 reactive intermediate/imine deaminase [Olsenella sp. An188]